ncbi:MAG TPA: hypothetical protein VJ550_11835 [Geomonas sp.]|nr:hypothetical protein [Geomonas sp.]
MAALTAPAAWATTWYVSPTGSNGGTGASSSPWQTLSYACSKAVSGDTIVVNAGTYTDNTTCSLKTGVKILGAGSSQVTINTSASTYISATNSLPVVNGGNEIAGINFVGTGTAINSGARSNQIIHDCSFSGFPTSINVYGKMYIYSNSCKTTAPTQTATYCDDYAPLSTEPGSTDWATGIQIYNNKFTNTKIYPNSIKSSTIHDNVFDNSGSLRSAVGNTSHWWNDVQFYNNTIKMQTNTWSTIAIEVWMVEGDTRFYNNWTNGWFSILLNPNGPNTPYSWEIVNNTFASNNPPGTNPVGQALETCYFTKNVLIAGNYFTNTGSNNPYNTAIGIHGKGFNQNFTIRNNVFYNIYGDAIAINSSDTTGAPFAGSNINISNNIFDTMHNGTSQGVYMQDGVGTINGVNIKNNIFTGVAHGALIYPSGNDVQNVVFNNNIVQGGNYTYNYGTASGVTNGGFTSVLSNYNLVPDYNATGTRPEPYYDAKSNAANFIDKGASVGLPYTGTAPDIGAFEYLLTPNPPSSIGVGP